jgi:hypothetical protein
MVEVIQYMLHGDSSRGPNKGADHGNTHDASRRRHTLDCFIRFAAGTTRNQRAAVGVGNEDRLSRCFDSIHRGPVAAMRNIHGHANFIHALHDLNAVLAEATVSRVGRSSADPVTAISKLRDPLAQLIEAVYVLDGSKMRGVLLANQDADLAESLCLFEIGDSLDALELLPVRRDERVPPGNVPH